MDPTHRRRGDTRDVAGSSAKTHVKALRFGYEASVRRGYPDAGAPGINRGRDRHVRVVRMNVRPVRPDEIDSVALVLAHSFEDDKLFTWMFGQSAVRALHRSFRSQIRAQYMPSGIVETVDDLSGAALWSAPGRGVGPTPLQMLRMIPGNLHFLRPSRAVKAFRGFAAMDSHHPDEPHIHLAVLGVDPTRQRSGVGSSLVRSGLARADEAHLPVYLDTSASENVSYYRRYGFDVISEFDFPLDGPHAWGMLRRPRAGPVP